MDIPLKVKPGRKPQSPKRKWGNWLFRDNLTLVHANAQYYDIDLEKMCRDEMLDWIFQLSGKIWVNKSDLGYFVDACKDIYDRESRYTTDKNKLFIIEDKYKESIN